MNKLRFFLVNCLLVGSFLLPFTDLSPPPQDIHAQSLQAANISGKVSDSDGSPVSGVTVTAYPQAGSVLVVDEEGIPVSGAEVYLFHTLWDETDSNGMVHIPSLDNGDRLAARSLVYEAPSNKDDHGLGSTQNWAYRVYITSVDIPVSGAPERQTVADATQLQTLVVKKSNTLIGFNIRATVEWDADALYLSKLEEAFSYASSNLYDASDGQMLFESVNITDNNLHMTSADFQFRASNKQWPRAHVGGILKDGTRHAYLGRYFNGHSSNQGDWPLEAGYRTLIHEFGHYGLGLRDSYYYFDEDENKLDAFCTSEEIRTNETEETNATLMDYAYNATEFSLLGFAGLWSSACENTNQFIKQGKSDWQAILDRYQDTQSPPRWLIKTPAVHGAVLAGPNSTPVASWRKVETSFDATTGVCESPVELYFELFGEPAADIEVVLRKTDRDIAQGKTNGNGEITILGASEGDLITVYPMGVGITFDSQPINCGSSLALNQQGLADLNFIDLEPAAFDMLVSTLPGGSANQLQIIVSAPADLPQPPQVTLTQHGGAGVDIPITYNAGLTAYNGITILDATLPGSGVIVASAENNQGQSASTFINFNLEAVDENEDSEIYSEDGMAELNIPAGSLPTGSLVTLNLAQSAAPIPDGKVLLGGPYQISLSQGAAFSGNGNLTLYYLDFSGSLTHANLPSALIYREEAGGWLPLPASISSQNEQMVSSPVSSAGSYAVLADWEAKVFLPVVSNGGLTQTSQLPTSLDHRQTVESFALEEEPTRTVELAEVFFTTTDSNGDYSFNSLADGSYLIVPSLEGSFIYPASRAVTIPPDAVQVNFTILLTDVSKMVVVPAGDFIMGCDESHNGGLSCSGDELPLQTIYLDEYFIDKYEVTNQEYILCELSGVCTTPSATWSGSGEDYYGDAAFFLYPVKSVNWVQAETYCTWVGKRLPSEAEWEKAARGPTIRAYPWGDDNPTTDLVSMGLGIDPQPVGSYPLGASPYGVLDMADNVEEWVNDWYSFDYYGSMPSSNPTGPATGDDRVLRGGSYLNYDYLIADRSFYPPGGSFMFDVGFRCAFTP